MFDLLKRYRSLFASPPPGLEDWTARLSPQLQEAVRRHGQTVSWLRLLASVPALHPSWMEFGRPAVRIGVSGDCDDPDRQHLEKCLRQLHPWRKGPFELFGIQIDSEWRCDMKWARLANDIQPLDGRVVLDVGAGNGYYGWRMLGHGAARVIGIDPTLRYVFQFLLIKQLAGEHPLDLLPLALEDLPDGLEVFDTVFSMGVLYHRRSPFDHLYALKDCLRPGGELVLETLVIEGGEGEVLVPRNRYAKMRNVWFIPTPQTLASWLERAGFSKIRCIDVSPTTVEEQRSTDWMRFHSLPEFVDPAQPDLTVEGLPAPLRAIFLAEKP